MISKITIPKLNIQATIMHSATTTTSGSGARQRAANKKMKQQQAKKLECHESMLTERLSAPKEVELFEQFEELGKLYAIEPPYISRSQVELVFDVYDGRKLQSGDLMMDEEGEQQMEATGTEETYDGNETGLMSKPSLATTSSGSAVHSRQMSSGQNNNNNLTSAASSQNYNKSHKRHLAPANSNGNFSWCRLLFNHKKRGKANLLSACFNKSDTAHDLAGCLMSKSSSGLANSTAWWTNGQESNRQANHQQQPHEPASEALHGSLAVEMDDDQDDAELKAEVRQIIGPLLNQLRRSSALATSSNFSQERQSLMLDQVANGGASSAALMEHQQFILANEASQSMISGNFTSGVSVCLFDKRGRLARLKLDAQNGRRWWFVEARLRELRWRLRGAWRTKELETKLDKFMSKRVRRALKGSNNNHQKHQQSNITSTNIAHDHCDDVEEQLTFSEKLNKQQLERLIDLSKNSLNHLIDAQLLLRNKLASEQEQLQQQQQPNQLQYSHTQLKINRANEYELLLRNNFNLLKIWQNLEETKHLVCFVCEPIKANLNDLFWFNRKQIGLNYNSGSPMVNSDNFVFRSPLVSLDSIQLKRGLLQILEALHYLHAICKLIHRNLTPANILIGSNDNWKLSGLEFALRFESATINESASIMAHEVASGSLLRYSLGSSAQATLRRQKTLQQTKCEDFIRPEAERGSAVTGGGAGANSSQLLQPQLDYLAPEIWKSAKCSHKSDIFSYGLILGQCYDLYRHKALICCRSEPRNYEFELKKLSERRKRRASRLVPFEMRSVLLGMLDLEPTVRPSANYALQLFRRPIELCKENKDSLKHLRRSLAYLDESNRCLSMGNQTNNNNNNNNNNTAHYKGQRSNYFRKVTSAANQSASGLRKQTKNLHLLNLLLRALDSLSNNNLAASMSSSQQHQHTLSGSMEDFRQFQNHPTQQQQQQQQQQLGFPQLRQLFEFTFESLIQVYKLTTSTTNSDTLVMCPDSRSLMLIVALHRQLLDQLAQMRAELPPVCRLTAANTQANRPTPNHRQLAELEERLHNLVSRHSMAKLTPVLTDPLLKLDEFLLVYEIVTDLLAFVGQKCRQNFIQRGRQLLNELTPVTGCPSLSSSDEEEEEEQQQQQQEGSGTVSCGLARFELVGGEEEQVQQQQQQQQQQQAACAGSSANSFYGSLNFVGGSSIHKHQAQVQLASAGSRDTLNNSTQQAMSNQSNNNKMNAAGRFGVEYYDDQQQLNNPNQSTNNRTNQHLQQQHRLQQANTKISITAPSPRGSIREVDKLINESTINTTDFRSNPSPRQGGVAAGNLQDQLVRRTSAMSLTESSQSSFSIQSVQDLQQQQQQQQQVVQEEEEADGMLDSSKSRSQLIDELLKTINDDSFNDFVDFNNKFSASNTPGGVSGKTNQLTAAQLANVGRPKSAMDGGVYSSSSSATTTKQAPTNSNSRIHQAQTQQQATGQRPSSLALNTNNQQQQQQQQQQPPQQQQFQHHQPHRHSTTPSTFDNVIRRMSTNFVQNFNKIGVGQTSASDQQQPQLPQLLLQQQQPQQNQDGFVRREKSSNYANSLYVDNQVPARRHSDNTINVPRIQVALSSPSTTYKSVLGNSGGGSTSGLNQRASVSASKLANKWKVTAKGGSSGNRNDKLSPNLSGALSYMRRHSSGNTTNGGSNDHHSSNQSNGQTAQLLLNASPFKTKSSSNLGFDFLMSNRSMKRRCSAASMLGHQTQKKAEDLIDAGMKSVQNMFN